MHYIVIVCIMAFYYLSTSLHIFFIDVTPIYCLISFFYYYSKTLTEVMLPRMTKTYFFNFESWSKCL